jgi:hypothetical protein
MSARRRRSAHPPMTAVAMPLDKLDLWLQANNLQQSWRFDREPPKAVLRDVWTIDWILGC